MEALRVGVLGAGTWARVAHVPGWQRDPRCEVAVICDVERDRARDLAAELGIPEATDDWQAVVARPDIDVIDVVHPVAHPLRAGLGRARGRQARPLREAGRLRLPPDPRGRPSWRASKGLKTKLGFTFRYSPGVQYAKSLIDEGFVGTPFIFNGYEQNSQWLDPQTPLRQVDHTRDQSVLQTVVAGRLRRPDHRHRPLVGRRGLRAASSARCATSSRSGSCAPPADDADEHRRRRHLHRRVHQRRASARSRPASSRSATTPASRPASTASRARSSAAWSRSSASPRRSRWPRRTTSSSGSSRSRERFYPAGGHPARVLAHPLLRQPDQGLPRRDHDRRRPRTRATSTTAPGSRRSSTPSSSRSSERRWVDLPLDG